MITDAATITAPGNNLKELWQRLLAGETAIRPVNRFPVDNYNSKIAACIEDLKPTGGRSKMHPLLDRLFFDMGPIPPDSFLITATTKAGIDNLESLRQGNPADFQDILLYSITDIVSQKLGLINNGINISASCASTTIAVALGAAMIASERTDAVLICCADLVTEFTFSGFSALKALSPVPCMPFDYKRNGMSLGEGAAALLLMSRKRAQRENREKLGSILGFGVANDASHITAPAKSGRGLIQAIVQALKTAKRKPEEIAAINAHGTGTIYNDLMELNAFRQVFGERKLPVYSVKGAIGHTLGAAGGIEVILGCKTLSTRIVPPTVGFSNPEDGANGQVSSEPQHISGDYLLTTNSGFGGVNAALILGK
ncbi:MAG: beta-ketoacyl-[acyl-carrier-protein] synthase family protein [Deltaproteobacteria bacterium]|nr:beta-ketoacyl-[acyl-carrier-protein] synthase family protein [Deltaproteobacteria bacterium]